MAWGRRVADWTIATNRLAVLALIASLAVGGASCQGSSAGSVSYKPHVGVSPPTAAKLSGDLPMPAGVDEALWDRLVDRLKQVLEDVADGDGEGTPLDESLSTPLLEITPQDNETILLTWPYRCVGDYNQSGEVEAEDLEPLALHFGKTDQAADWEQARIADGDGNGEVNISDVTPIGVNYGTAVGWYHVGEAASAQAQEWILRARVSLSCAEASADGCLNFALQLSDPQDGYYYRVTPQGGAGSIGAAQPSEPVPFIVPIPTAPIVQATDGEFSDRVELSWTPSPWATYYKVYRDAQSPPIAELYHETSWVDETVWDANEHTYWVRAMNERSQSGYGDGDVGFKAASPAVWASFSADARHTGRSSAIGPETPDIKWLYSERDIYNIALCVVSAEGIIYIVTHENLEVFYLTALDPSGSALWDVELATEVYCSPCIGPDGVVYVQTISGHPDGGYLYAISLDGNSRWTLALTQRFPASISPVCASDGTIYTYIYVGDDFYILALDPYGNEIRRIKLTGNLKETPALGPDGTIYAVVVGPRETDFQNRLQAFTPTGELLGTFPLPELSQSCPCVADDGTAYVTCGDGNLYAVKPDGTEYWHVFIDICHPMINSTSATVGHDGTIYISSKDAHLHAINPDGTEKWSCFVGYYLYQEKGSAAIDGAGNVYYMSKLGQLNAIDPDGNIRWQTEQPEWPSATRSPAIGPDGTVYFILGTTLYAVGPP